MAEVRLTIGAIADKLQKELNRAKGYVAKFTNYVKSHQQQIKKMRMAAGVALAGEVLAIRQVVKAYETQESADKKLAQAIKSTGSAAGYTFEELKKMGKEYQNLTTFGDDVVNVAQAQLLTFTKIGRDIFPDVLEVAMDMATLMGTDLKSSIIQVGKAFQDPILGATALRRVGVNLSAQQTEQIKQLVEMGDLQGAQALLMAELTSEFGGQARAAADGAGALKQFSNQWSDLQEALGKAILPLLTKIVDKLKEHLPQIQEWIENNGELIAMLVGGGVGGTGLILLLSQFALAFSNPVTGIIAVIGLAVMGIASLIVHFRTMKAEIGDLPTELAKVNEEISKTKDKIAELQAQEEEKGASMSIWEAIGLAGGGKHGAVSGGAQSSATKRMAEINELQKRLEALLAIRKQLAASSPSAAGGGAGTVPADIEQPNIFWPEGSDEQAAVAGENHAAHVQSWIDAEQEKYDMTYSLNEQAAYGMVSVWESAFMQIMQLEGGFMNKFGMMVLEGMSGMLQMMVDAYVNSIIAKQVESTAKAGMEALFNPAALGKLALIGAAAGTAKGLLGGIVSKARGQMSKSIPKFQYGGVVGETGYALMHKGEHVFNPEYPGESIQNMSGVRVNVNFAGAIVTEDIVRHARDSFNDYLFSRRMARSVG